MTPPRWNHPMIRKHAIATTAALWVLYACCAFDARNSFALALAVTTWVLARLIMWQPPRIVRHQQANPELVRALLNRKRVSQ